MLRVMIVDDEDIIRNGIRENVPWNENGFEVVAEASDGKDALEILDYVLPDIIITDIRMRYIDGLEFVELLRKKYPDMYVIIMTGYEDFDYAKKAIDMHVYKYFLKPVKAYIQDSLNSVNSSIEGILFRIEDVSYVILSNNDIQDILRKSGMRDDFEKSVDKTAVIKIIAFRPGP